METHQISVGEVAGVKTTRYLIAILISSVVLRVVAAVVMGNGVETLPGIDDQLSYHTLAQQILAGRGFTMPENWWPLTRAGEPTAHWSYLYTLYLALVYGVFGVSPLIARMIQVVLVGVLWPLLAYRIGRRIAGDGVGLITAAWTALYGYFIYYTAALMTEPIYITAVLWSLDLTLGGDGKHTSRRWVLLGLAMGLAVLLRQSFLLFIPFLLLYAWTAEIKRRRLAAMAQSATTTNTGKVPLAGGVLRLVRFPVLALLVLGLMILPWTIRNAFAFQRFILLNTNAGFAFFWANHPIYGTNFVGILPPDVSYQSLIPSDLYALDEAALDSALLKQGISYVMQDPVRYVLLSLSRFKTYFMFWPSGDSSPLSNAVRVLSFGVGLPFMLYGLLVAVRRWRNWLLLYLFIIVYSGIHLLSWALIRYRLPVDAVLIVFAAYGVVDLVRRLTHSRVPRPLLADQ
ncbi:MAG: glycosyltransferase family 39 protein [Chloroflexi bacterium]|nr:glycosyltransferase family 39 protein [Chloroflexota bacterium]